MAFSILSDDTKSKLEQERSRLIEERDSIIQAAVTQATAEVDQMLQQLNQMLGYDTPVATNGTAKAAASAKPKQSKQAASKTSKAAATAKATPKTKAIPTSKAAPAAKASATATKATPSTKSAPTAKASAVRAKLTASASKGKSKPASSAMKSTAPAQPLVLKPDFKSLTPTEAVKQILTKAGKPLTTDEVIRFLYQSVKESDLMSARKSVGLILGRGAYQGVYEKVAEDPSRYQIKA